MGFLATIIADVSSEIMKKGKVNFELIEIMEVMKCECCGLHEECTPRYEEQVKSSHGGKWLCGLCCEVVKERMEQSPEMTVKDAIRSHKEFREAYVNTIKLNPKLALTDAMREIVKKCQEKRSSNKGSSGRVSFTCVTSLH